jgi:molecular chaperone GrpE
MAKRREEAMNETTNPKSSGEEREATAVLEDLEALRERAMATEKERDEFRALLQRTLDNFERAVAAAKQAGETGPLVQGVSMIQAQVLDALRRHGINRIEALGKPFDPTMHEAVQQQPTSAQAPDTVLQVLEPGYTIHDRVLRPARVVVAAAPAQRQPSNDGKQEIAK